MHDFTLLVLITALISFFLEEIGQFANRFWGSLVLRNFGLIFILSFFFSAFNSSLQRLFFYLLYQSKLTIVTMASYLPFSLAYNLVLAHVIYGMAVIIGLVIIFAGLYYIGFRKLYNYLPELLWFNALTVMTLLLAPV